jgi:hypothetical protein
MIAFSCVAGWIFKKKRRLDIFFFKLWKSLNDVISRVPAGDLV